MPPLPRLRAPIVLVHGLLGFDRIQLGGWVVKRYFPGIAEYLSEPGTRVRTARLSQTRSVAERAAQLRRFILKEFPGEPVHILGHSMGGLDARHMISHLGMADHVLSLTTIGTPHRGTCFADLGVRTLEWLLAPLFRMFGVSVGAFHDLTTHGCRRFNENTPDMPGVRYFSVAGKCDTALMKPLYWLPHHIVTRNEGPNDGLVSLESAKHGESFEVWDADHMSLVNWTNQRAKARGLWSNRMADYGRIVQRLATIKG